jgi:ATP-dependent DNA ligase
MPSSSVYSCHTSNGASVQIIKSSPVLESRTRTGASKFWQGHVYQDGRKFYTGTSYWQVNLKGVKSKVTFSEPYEALPKNVGRANETSALIQAHSEFDSFVLKQRDKGYSDAGSIGLSVDIESDSPLNRDSNPLPMLAHKFRDHGHKVKFPCFVQPKLDGMRMLFNGERAWSRGNKAIIPDVIKHLLGNTQGYILDGELILPGNGPLQDTMSAAKKFRPGISDKLQYWVYDIVDPTKTYAERKKILEGLHSDLGNKNIIFTPTPECISADGIQLMHKQYVGAGYEGTIIRDPKALYEVGHRSYGLMKLKDAFDEEFEIVDVIEGGGIAAGQAIFKCKTKNGGIFDSTPQATHTDRREMFKERDKLIGKWATVKHYGYTKDGIPMFQNTVAVRDWDDFN